MLNSNIIYKIKILFIKSGNNLKNSMTRIKNLSDKIIIFNFIKIS